MDEVQNGLLQAFCPPLDSSLVLSVFFESADEQSARAVLEVLAASAEDPLLERDKGQSDVEVQKALSEWTLNDDTSTSSIDSSLPGDPLSFLVTLFPGRSRVDLQAALAQEEGDTLRVVDDILSQDYIAHEMLAGSVADIDGFPDELMTPSHRKTKKRKTRQAKTISLTDVLQRQQPHGSDSESDWSDYASTGNSWVSLDSQASYLADKLMLPVGYVASAYHRADSNWAVALENLLDELEVKRPFDKLALAETCDLSTSINPTDTKRLLCGSNGDVSAALDLAKFRTDRSGAAMQRFVKSGANDARRAIYVHADTATHRASPIIAQNGDLPRTPSGSGSQMQRGPSLSGVPGHLSTEDYRQLAGDHWRRRSNALRQAVKHYNMGDRNMRQAASFWGEEAREHERRAREFELRAARALVRDRQGRATERGSESTSVDLHNLNVSQALTVTKESVNTWWASAPHPPPLRIVTGKGTHSAHGQSVLAPAIMRMLEREGWHYSQESAGVLKVTGILSATQR